MKKQAKVFSINTAGALAKQLSKVTDLLDNENFREAIKHTKEGIRLFPDEFIFYLLHGLSYSSLGNTHEALKTFKIAAAKFPDNFEFQYNLARIYEIEEKYELAEKHYLKALELTPEYDKKSRSDFLNDLSALYWNTGREDEAMEKVKLALSENPDNAPAQKNLLVYEMGTGPEAELFDDIEMFRTIQVEKYLVQSNKLELMRKSEIEQIVGIIFEAWNNEVAPQKEKLDSLSAADKSKWFKSIKIDFSKIETFEKPDKKNKKTSTRQQKESGKDLDFLPESTIKLIPYLQLLLDEAGLSSERLQEIRKLGNQTDEEIEILHWAIEVALEMFELIEEDDFDEKDIIMEGAVDIAADYIPRIKSREILLNLQEVLEEEFG